LIRSGVVPLGTDIPTRHSGILDWAICLGTSDVDQSNIGNCLDLVKELGASYVRMDFSWGLLMPHEGQIDDAKVDQYDNVVRVCEEKGVAIVAVVGAGGTWPDWAKNKYNFKRFQGDYQRIRDDWIGLCRFVAQNWGGSIRYFQVLNEENHVYHQKIRVDEQCPAIKDAHDAISSASPGSEIIVNVHTSVPSWESWKSRLARWLRDAGEAIDVVAIDHYPGTYTFFTGPGDWAALDQLMEICKANRKKGAIMETGFSSWAKNDLPWYCPIARTHDEKGQVNFINQALPIILNKVREHNRTTEYKIAMASWFTLTGDGQRAWTSLQALHLGKYVEPNFGAVKDHANRKLCFDALKEQISAFYD